MFSTPSLTQINVKNLGILHIDYWNGAKCEKQPLGMSIISNNKNNGAMGKKWFLKIHRISLELSKV